MSKPLLLNRKKRIFFLYQNYLFNWNKRKFIGNLINSSFFNFPKEEIALIKKIQDHIEETEIEIEKLLVNWTWERIPCIEKAILVNFASEIKIFKLEKSIAISEALKYVEKYSNNISKKYINAILDKF